MFGRNLRSKYWWRRVDEEVGSEFEFHIEMRAREYVARGMDPEAARELARQRFGNLGAVWLVALLAAIVPALRAVSL